MSLERSTFLEVEWVQDLAFRPCRREISRDLSTYVRSRRYEWVPPQRRRASSRRGFDRSHHSGHAIRTSHLSLFSSLDTHTLIHRYSLLRHNCNHFTDTALQFLTGKNLPSRILNQASEFLATPLGQQIGPMIEAFSGNMSDRVPGTFRTVVTPPVPPTTTTTTVPAPKPKNPLVSNLKSLHNLISKRKGMLLSKGTSSFTSLQNLLTHSLTQHRYDTH